MMLDFGTGEVRMKKISEYPRFCEWEPEIYMNNFIIMKLDILPSPLETHSPLELVDSIGQKAQEKFLSSHPAVQGVLLSIRNLCI